MADAMADAMADPASHRSKNPPPLLHRIKWFNFTMLITIPLIAFLCTPYIPLLRPTLIWSLIYYLITMISITAGYHRLWSHRTYTAATPLRLLLALFGAGAIQGSIKFWARNHRLHHRYTDTPLDPYNITQGFFHAHILWTILHQPPHPKPKPTINITDLTTDPIIQTQHKHYLPLCITMGWLFPSLIAGFLWNDWVGGFLYAGILRAFFVNQATFCVNSLAHWIGGRPFDERKSARESVVVAMVTLGEGYHNYHHVFPGDYRCGRSGGMWMLRSG
ncbi:delta-9 desaturase isoenzyme B [Aspergillus sclerotioniger CBS 115572]|uniref:Delta-9 desaturase isoenzyme B n=1 Tax=Aspergillus sclerotioniger CBS 115572 TaxID=1450535 RepID=A0A317VFG5_9EURO|nr:delta-9 desaturase isoenzyme B [Aspergillus sclerotioniger CBS 115572]PWY73126.1 delta-9 desaturase isoenzyme B [Aspergillus sclerotioniger CBS 115572]